MPAFSSCANFRQVIYWEAENCGKGSEGEGTAQSFVPSSAMSMKLSLAALSVIGIVLAVLLGIAVVAAVVVIIVVTQKKKKP